MPNKPTPPPGYSLQDVPDFLKPVAASMRVVVEPPNGVDIARVTAARPDVIQVNQRDQFGQPQLNHEVTHGFQFSRNPAVVRSLEAVPIARTPNAPMQSYDYGGIAGLLAARMKGKTIADFNMEQQAQMVKDWQSATKQAIASGDTARLDLVNRAYAPFIRQLANLPGKNESMTTMTERDLTPPAPGLPPSAETGIMEPNPLLGGVARALKRVPRLPRGYTLQ